MPIICTLDLQSAYISSIHMLSIKRHGLVSNIPSHQSLLVPNLSLKPYYVPDRPHEGDDASGQDSIEPELRVSHVANMLNVTIRVSESCQYQIRQPQMVVIPISHRV